MNELQSVTTVMEVNTNKQLSLKAEKTEIQDIWS